MFPHAESCLLTTGLWSKRGLISSCYYKWDYRIRKSNGVSYNNTADNHNKGRLLQWVHSDATEYCCFRGELDRGTFMLLAPKCSHLFHQAANTLQEELWLPGIPYPFLLQPFLGHVPPLCCVVHQSRLYPCCSSGLLFLFPFKLVFDAHRLFLPKHVLWERHQMWFPLLASHW